MRIRRPTIHVLLLLGLSLMAALACGRSRSMGAPTSNVSEHTVMFDGLEREYTLVLPSAYEEIRSMPLVLALHGGGGNGKQLCRLKGVMQELVESEGFILVCPDGIEKHWNDGREHVKWRSHVDKIDDVGFLKALIEMLEEEYSIDSGRIYVTGISNGGKMSLRLACEATEVFASAASVAASLPADLECQPSGPISIMIMNGMDDPFVPWEGGQVKIFRQELGEALSTPETVEFWVESNGCNPEAVSEWLMDVDPDDHTRIRLETYSGCYDHTEVRLYSIQGGGHTWPGGPQYLPDFLIGAVSGDVHAGEVIWDFFDRPTIQHGL